MGRARNIACRRHRPPLFGTLAVPEGGRAVLYVALEGSRQALRARIGALARGIGLDPDADRALERLRMLYRPRPFSLADLADAQWLHDEAAEHDAALIVVDVLRRARPSTRTALRTSRRCRRAQPLLADGLTVALLHHFAKLTETQNQRQPGERMSGTERCSRRSTSASTSRSRRAARDGCASSLGPRLRQPRPARRRHPRHRQRRARRLHLPRHREHGARPRRPRIATSRPSSRRSSPTARGAQ